MSSSDAVAARSKVQEEAVKRSRLPRTLMGGTAAMRAAATTYLPQEEAEPKDLYQKRLERSFLFNGFGKTVTDMTGRVFEKPIAVNKEKGEVPPELEPLIENVDLTGRHLNVFAKAVFEDAMQTGISYILVDMPQALENATRADEQQAGIRPYWCHVTQEELLGWKSRLGPDGQELTQVRIAEKVEVEVDEWTVREVEQIRVLGLGTWEIWRIADDGPDKGEWYLWQSGTRSVQAITLVPVYINRHAFMVGSPPLQDLADLNVMHWQSSSDQRNILHVARVPILFGSGFDENAQIAVGASSMIRAGSPDAKLVYVEHTGAAISAGRDDLLDIEKRMAALGLQLVVDQGGQTATGEKRDSVKELSPLAMMATALQDALEQALAYSAEYMGLGPDKGGSLVVHKDFSVSVGDQTEITNIIAAREKGLLSKETAWVEMQRRGFLSEDFDPDEEAELLEADLPDLPLPGDTMPPGEQTPAPAGETTEQTGQ